MDVFSQKSKIGRRLALALSLFTLVFLLVGMTAPAQQPKRVSPSDTVRQFYKLLHEKKYQEAFKLSVFSPAVEKLTPELMKHLEPDFQAMADSIPENIEISGENITGASATVYIKVPPPPTAKPAATVTTTVTDKNQPMGIVKTETKEQMVNLDGTPTNPNLPQPEAKPNVKVDSNTETKDGAGVIKAEAGTQAAASDKSPVNLILVNGQWLIGDTETQQLVAAHGANYFFLESAGIFEMMQNNEGQIYSLLNTLALVEQSFASQNQGTFLTLDELGMQGYIKDDLRSGRLFGYTFGIELNKDRSKFAIYAIPDEYNKTGRYSYYADPSGVQASNNGGVKFKPAETTARQESK